MRSIHFDGEEHLPPDHCFPILIEYTDAGEQVWIDDPEDIDDQRPFKVKSTKAPLDSGDF